MASAVQKFVSKPLDIKAYGTRPRQGKEHIRDLLYDCAVHLAAGNDRDTKLLVNDFCQYFMEEPAAPDSDGELTSEETVVRNVIEAFNACGQKDKDHALRRAYLQLVVGAYKFPLLKSMGMHVGQPAYKRADDKYKRDGIVASVDGPKRGGGNKKEGTEAWLQAQNIWESHAVPTPYGKPGDVMLDRSPGEIIQKIRESTGLGKRLARKSRPKHIKNPTQATDVCDKCTKHKAVGVKMEVTMRKLESAYRVPRSQLDSAMGVLDKYRLGKRQVRNRPLQIHVEVKNVQNGASSADTSMPRPAGEVTAVLDFGKKLPLGHGKIEVGDVWRRFGFASLLGVVFFLPFQSVPVYIDLISEICDQSAFGAVLAFGRAVEECMRMFPASWEGLKVFKVWSDTGNHFRAWVFISYLMHTLPMKLRLVYPTLQCVIYNMYCEGHGKGACDRHFNVIRVFLLSAWKACADDEALNTVPQMVRALRDQVRCRVPFLKCPDILVYEEDFSGGDRFETAHCRELKDKLKGTHCLKAAFTDSGDLIWFNMVLSGDSGVANPIHMTFTQTNREKEAKKMPVQPAAPVSMKNLKRKQDNLEEMLGRKLLPTSVYMDIQPSQWGDEDSDHLDDVLSEASSDTSEESVTSDSHRDILCDRCGKWRVASRELADLFAGHYFFCENFAGVTCDTPEHPTALLE